MRCTRQDFVKPLVTILVVVIVALSFQSTLSSANGYKTTTETSRGLYTATLNTPQGKINVNLPADMAVGDTISGTVYQEAAGKTGEERTKNLSELNGIVVEVEEIKDKQTPATKKRDSWIIPTAISAMHLVFKDKDGKELGRAEVPVYPEPPVSSPLEFKIPVIGQAGNPLRIPGPFDGNFASSMVRIDDFDVETLAESPRGLIVLAPHKVTGQAKITLKEGDVELSGEYRNVSVQLTAGKLHLKRGQTTEMTVTVKGLDRLEDEVPLRLQNKSPGTINMEGGTIQDRIIRAGDIGPGGIYTMTRTLTGKVPGGFHISAKIHPELKQYAEQLGSYTGNEYRMELTDKQKDEILTMAESSYINFMKNDLNIYKNSTHPSVTPQMKAWADELLDFLNSAKPEDQQWLANIYVDNLSGALVMDSQSPPSMVPKDAFPDDMVQGLKSTLILNSEGTLSLPRGTPELIAQKMGLTVEELENLQTAIHMINDAVLNDNFVIEKDFRGVSKPLLLAAKGYWWCVGKILKCEIYSAGCIAAVPAAVAACGSACLGTIGFGCIACVITAGAAGVAICERAWDCWKAARDANCF
ncbi:MAG: hypothetical protein PVH61_22780 [Candidatus Aminicenantes bacterium]|jgi:hypothetical protein